jgi:putative nucleotidyltransferase with HDIG domain
MLAADHIAKAGRAYFRTIPIIGVCVMGWALLDLFLHPPAPAWLALAALTVLTGSFTVKIPGLVARLSVSEPFVFAATLWFGPPVGAVTAALDALIMSLWLLPSLKTVERVVFNVSVLVISIWVASQGFFVLSGIDPRNPVYNSLAEFVLPLYLFTACSFLLNSGLIAIAISFERGQSAFRIWREQFLWLSLNYFGGASVAAVLVVYAKSMDWAIVGIIIPLLAISYLTFRTTLGRLDDANEHLTELNRLYLSTIETLAMAIDAKDQITHGHIRRVQRLAVGLAKAMGVNEETQLKAIEAAALLHDMGKLAIPEFILNKPGKLTPNEFDVMKQHANIGADILGSIHFPYPVVPIVRHHHEAWNGTGYPDKLKGVSIPLGARILSVVDCFDALTSDRPYRPRMSVEDSIAVLIQRRGTMYDPLIVDKFIEAQAELSELAECDDAEKEAIDSIATKLRLIPEVLVPAPTEASERLPLKALTLLRSVKPSPAGTSTEDLGLIVSKQLSKLTGFSSIALYCLTENEQAIKCRYADKPLAELVNSAEIPLGERLSGWVAAHRTAVWNSDATLDLPMEVAKAADVALGSSVPLMDGEVLVGTLTFYCHAGKEIAVEQRLLIQSIAPLLASAVSASTAHDEVVAIDATKKSEKEALYSIIDTLISSRSQWPDRSHPDRLTIVLVSWQDSSLEPEKQRAIQVVLQRAISSATNGTGHLLRLSNAEMLITAPLSVLSAAGLGPNKSSRPNIIQVSEIVNSLQLREVLGLTHAGEPPTLHEKPSIH